MTIRQAPLGIDRFRADVLEGLSQPRKRLPAKYFYDEAGSRLFDRITELDEYYPTRTELAIMREHVHEMAAHCGPECVLIEPGAGSLLKVRLLLNALSRPVSYIPLDVSGQHLSKAARELAQEYPGLEVCPLIADFSRTVTVPKFKAQRRVIYFPGSTLGNFEPSGADALLRRFARMVGPGGGLILGVDLRKDPSVLEAAYNDALGVTAAFNRNLLVRINRELEADFNLEAFKHFAYYNIERSRIEMHLISKMPQQVMLGKQTFTFRTGESIHTENSYKYDLDEFAIRAANWNMRVDQTWTDPNSYFAVLYLSVVGRFI